ncbi:MAG TPA: hypothetical protein VJQ47_12265 [Steroidobacteraceae bacterium]|nr:hypothetical protein [Steroidobacteraceae bacterium]
MTRGHVKARRGASEYDSPVTFLEDWSRKSSLLALGAHAPYTAAPLLDHVELVENASDDMIAELGDAAPKIFYGQPGDEKAGTIYLDTIIKNGNPYGTSSLSVVRMYDAFTMASRTAASGTVHFSA